MTPRHASPKPAFRILTVDDDEDIRSLIRASLENEFEVVEASDGLDCLQKMEIAEPDFVILDVMMPLMNGLKTCGAIRRDSRFGSVPILLLSALTSHAEIREGYTAGANLYLTKPFDPARLLKMVHSELERGGNEPRPKTHPVDELPNLLERNPAQQSADKGALSQGNNPKEYLWRPPAGKVQVLYPSGVLPTSASDGEGVEAGIDGADARDAKAQQARVMIVDDDQDVRTLLTNELSEHFEVTQAADGIEAVEKIVRYEPDLIIIDGMMPRMTGFQLCQSIRRNSRFQRTPILFISAKSSERDKKYAHSVGANEFIGKPFDLDDIVVKLKGMMELKDFFLYPKRIAIADIDRIENRDKADATRLERNRSAVQSGLKIPPSAVSESFQAITEFMRDEKNLGNKRNNQV